MFKQAMPGPGQFEKLNGFLQGIEEIVEYMVMPGGDPDNDGQPEPDQVFEWLCDQWDEIGPLWRRVLFAGQVAIDNACDPNAKTLEWKPEIAAALKAAEAGK